MKYFNYILLIIFLMSCSDKTDKILPEEQVLTESVYASVTIQPDSLYQSYAIVSGILDANLVEEGDAVIKDEIIIQIINNTPKLNTQNSKLALDLAKQNYKGSAAILNSIKDEIEATRLKYKNDSINYYRQENLWKQNIGSKVQYDSKKLNYELSSNSLRLLQSKYTRTKNELETAVQQAQNNYLSALINTKDFAVKSKINGKVYALYKEPGEIVTTMEPLAAIGSTNNFIIELLVDEVDIVRIAKGQNILITLDAYNNEVFKGKVSKIYPKKDERNQTFLVEGVFNNAPPKLYPGLSGEANIVIAKRDNALTIPKTYLIDGSKVKTDDGIVTVETGLQSMEHVEILLGITKETYIHKPD
ncbi:MAG: HlyD family efflux transporter periplasmic adaptor subunit [Winogradskyella sp.]|uniref:efflux RND transporter periplasmic adaptor subunit n=1 Tax=Winogradskyella sp. TaxID=1883156 RepID=UPI0017E5A835|nr:efflux RND transporter periplasmic adaptor subunit [Winogradskyella sp.]MBT8245975.1 efflux RND transporter periplasmic adaptor subunit [Winogradskyella sp.]NNK22508.1 HlyD family efflux transporter periplasmic adaptor subunit [Winogradskyella sp.]